MRTAMTWILVLSAFVLPTMPVAAAVYSGQTGFHLDWWDSENGTDGYQYHIPIEAGGEIQHLSFRLITAYVYNEFTPVNEAGESFSGLADTKVNLAYERVAGWPVDVLFALDFNLPTGQTGLSDSQVIAISNPDQVTITRMGEGFNANPNISLLKQWDALYAAVGIGYLWRGSYDASDTLLDYDPGNALNITAAVDYLINPRWTGSLFGSFTQFDKDTLAEVAYYEPGDVNIFGVRAAYTRKTWDLSGSIKTVLRNKERRQNGFGVLQPESSSYYGDEWRAQLKGHVQL
ncbi:MAG: hypothetical protein HKP58_17370, partial [Desulfatitalea sp.]|nr:hypothetical protein [Desulfatitalea sp.]NNK02184.1 hypothetical protein [Desulfatitalea sp.]